MTDAQYDALVVLANVPPGTAVRGWKRRSRSEPTPMVNARAADSLIDLGYAEAQLTIGLDYSYRITSSGVRTVVREDRRRRAAA